MAIVETIFEPSINVPAGGNEITAMGKVLLDALNVSNPTPDGIRVFTRTLPDGAYSRIPTRRPLNPGRQRDYSATVQNGEADVVIRPVDPNQPYEIGGKVVRGVANIHVGSSQVNPASVSQLRLLTTNLSTGETLIEGALSYKP